MTTLLFIALFGALGSLIRFHFGGFVHTSVNTALASEEQFPFGTLFVNIAGSFLLGFLTGLSINQDLNPFVLAVLGTGFCGALTTFSTLAVDVQRFIRDRRYVHAALDVILTIFSGVGAAWAGFAFSAT